MTPFVSGSLLVGLRPWRPLPGLLLALLVTACASPSHRAPVEERAVRGQRPAAVVASATPAPLPVTAPAPTVASPAALSAPSGAIALPVSPSGPAIDAPPPKPPPGIENLGKPGYYAVKPGDTMIRIGLDTGQNWRDIVRWNNLDNANLIEVGQVLRVVPPNAEASAAAAVRPAGAASGVPASAPVLAVPAAPAVAVAGGAASAVVPPVRAAAGPAAAAVPNAVPPASQAASGDDDLNWAWPASGPVLAAFDEARSKGLAIGGRAGDPVLAAADGRVVYAGSGLRGYGNLVIVKHNNTFLTAYAHNQTLLVKEDQNVRRGQRIAEMGSTDAERVQLHFEIRRQGRPVDPARLLPAR